MIHNSKKGIKYLTKGFELVKNSEDNYKLCFYISVTLGGIYSIQININGPTNDSLNKAISWLENASKYGHKINDPRTEEIDIALSKLYNML